MGAAEAWHIRGMCLVVWVASAAPIAPVPNPQVPDAVDGYHAVVDVAADDPVRARFSLPHVSSVNAHAGCGCGFASNDLTRQGFVCVDEATPFVDAMLPREQAAFAAEQRSRTLLRAVIERALLHGAVEVYGCWFGDEERDAESAQDVEPAWFTEQLSPVAERVLYSVRDRALRG